MHLNRPFFFTRTPYRDKTNITSGNIFAEITDHLPIYLGINSKGTSTKARPLVRIISDKKLDDFKTQCEQYDWNGINDGNTVDEKFEIFQNSLITLFEESFPLIKKSRKRMKDKKWITKGILKSIKHKDKLYKKQIRSPTVQNIEEFKKYRNILETIMKASEENYYHNLFSDTKTATFKLWETLGHIINPSKSKKQKGINKLKIGDNVIDDKAEISNHMNNYFCTIGKKLASEIPEGRHFSNYMKNNVAETIFLEPIFEEEIQREIRQLNNIKSAGHDNISPKIIKICEPYIKTPLTQLFNYSLESAIYPSSLKLAKVIALYKKKSILLPENYRPISLLSCLDKIFEKLLHKRFMKFINKHKIIILNQYGFLKFHSTTMALIDVIDNIRNMLDKGEYALGVYLDFKKAFDTVDHRILLCKLNHYGFRGHTNKFIESYLSDRLQYTVVNGVKSNINGIETGVPQGSVLGPLFFLIYINDIINCIDDGKTTLFADDTTILFHDQNLMTLKQKAEKGMEKVYDWLLSNKLSLSWEKTFFMIYHSPKKNINNFQELKVYNFLIKRVTTIKYLGMHIDDQLKWDKHINHICNSLSRNFHLFYSIRNLLSDQLKRQLYFSLVHSRILYGIELYAACTNKLLNKIQVIQFHNYYRFTVHDHNTRNINRLYANQCSPNRYGESTLHYRGTQLWNLLDDKFKKSKSVYIFKKAIKQKMFINYS